MALVNIPNTFVAGTKAEAAKVNANFAAVATGVNGIDNANVVPTAAVEESKILFSDTGHDHSGGVNGANVAVAGATYGTVKQVSGVGVTASGPLVPPYDSRVTIDISAHGFVNPPLVMCSARTYVTGVYVKSITATSFECVIRTTDLDPVETFDWVAIGV